MDLLLTDKAVAITGAGRGLGRATACHFLSEGARVLSVDRSFPDDYAMADYGTDRHRTATIDVSSEAAAGSVIDVARTAFGSIDILVLNAGRHSSKSIATLTAAEIDLTLRTNVLGAAFALRAFARALPTGGAAVIVGSTATKSVQRDEFTYRASKYALGALAEIRGAGIRSSGVRVNIVTPGAIATGFVVSSAEQRKTVLAEIPMHREAVRAEIAAVVVFVASPRCSYMTGSEIVVDGGLSIRPTRPGQ